MRILAILALTALSLSACADDGPYDGYDHRSRFDVTVESRDLVVTSKSGSPDATEMAGLRALAREYLRRPAAPVLLSGPPEETAKLAQLLTALGLRPEQISQRAVEPGPIEIAAPVWQAKVPECGHWQQDLTWDQSNRNTDNFGCAVTRNMGLMIADPADLVRARESSARSGTRAVDVLDKYGQGKATSSAAEPNASSTVSAVAK